MRLIFITALFLIPLFGFSSFPTTENGAYDISNTINFQMDEHEQFSFEFLFPFLKGILGSTLMYLLWKWVKKNRNLSNGKINWNELHWAWKALLILIILSAVLGVLAIIFLIREFSLQ